jgi:alpha-beta hydrolase superfamily lysophospholipase
MEEGRSADELFVRVVPAQGEVRARVAIVHGFAEHGGRYRSLADRLAARRVESHLIDGHGHGRSPGPRGLVPSEEAAVGAVIALLERVRALDGDARVALFGHSFGGALVLRAAQLRPDLVDAVVASAPYLVSALPDPPWLIGLASAAARLAPRLRTKPLDAGTVSKVEAEVRAYDQDPLVDRGGVRLGSIRALHAIGPHVLADAEALVTPTLIVHGSDDALASPEGSRQLYLAAEGGEVELREVPGGAHALLHDVQAERIEEGIVAWLAERLALPGPGAAAPDPAPADSAPTDPAPT